MHPAPALGRVYLATQKHNPAYGRVVMFTADPARAEVHLKLPAVGGSHTHTHTHIYIYIIYIYILGLKVTFKLRVPCTCHAPAMWPKFFAKVRGAFACHMAGTCHKFFLLNYAVFLLDTCVWLLVSFVVMAKQERQKQAWSRLSKLVTSAEKYSH